MKSKIHPTYHEATVTCACGNTFTTGSTMESIQVEVCSNCHPFYTGKSNLIDTQGRVDRFKRMMEQAEKMKSEKAAKAKKSKNTTSKKEAKNEDAKPSDDK